MKRIIFLAIIAGVFAAFTAPPGYQPGDKAIDFRLKSTEGKMTSLADFKDAKGFIVVFTCNHCPFAVKYEDRIKALNTKYAAKGYPVVAINPNDVVKQPEDSYDNMKVRYAEKQFNFPYLYDENQEIAKAYGAVRTPHIYILQKSGADLIVKYVGAIDDNADDASAAKEKYAESALDKLLKGENVDPAFTKAIGCTIKWKQ